MKNMFKWLLTILVFMVGMITLPNVVVANEIAIERPPGFVITINLDNNVIVFENQMNCSSNSYSTGIEVIENTSPANVEPFKYDVVMGGTVQDKTLSLSSHKYISSLNLKLYTDNIVTGKSYTEMGYSLWYIDRTSSRECKKNII